MPTIDKAHALVNTLLKNASGEQNVSYDPSTAISVATTSLGITKDAMFNAITDMVNKTIIKENPYKGKLSILRADSEKFGYITRKVQYSDLDFEESSVYDSAGSCDQYERRNPNPIQTNYYGKSVVSNHITTYDYQLATAFTGASEMQSFVQGYFQNIANTEAKKEEELARAGLLNFMAGKGSFADLSGGVNTGVYHLITDFNTEKGFATAKTWDDIQSDPELYSYFIRWAYAYIARISDLMTERTSLFHFNITGHKLNKFTDKVNQRAFILSRWGRNADAEVLSTTFHNDLVPSVGNVTYLNYWQSPLDPEHISVIPSYLNVSDGSITHDTTAYNFNNAPVVGCIIDREAVGYTIYDQSLENTPHNARGKYYNTFWNYDFRYWNDFIENGAVFVLD